MSVRSKDQLAVMLKLIDVNRISLTRKNLSVRQRVWQVITHKLNQIQGAEKDMDGWKRSYYTWRLSAGSDYEKEMQRVIKDVPDDDYFYINVAEEKALSDNDGGNDAEATIESPTERQCARLHELVSRHRLILQSTSDDEPLKTRMWQNITDELNSIPGALHLTASEWKKRVDWSKYYVRRGRKPKNGATTISKEQASHITDNVKFELIDNDTMGIDLYEQEYKDFVLKETAAQQSSTQSCSEQRQESEHSAISGDDIHTEDDDYEHEDIEKLLNDEDDDFDYNFDDDTVLADDTDVDYQPEVKRIRPTPLVKNFQYSNRIVNAVEKLSDDVRDIKDLLKQTTSTLACLENVLQQHCKKQNETNALLKRNGQLLKVLVEYKCGRRTSGVST